MPFWPFKKSVPEALPPTELRDKLLATAATGSDRELRSLCKQLRTQIAQNLDVICRIPDGMPTDDGAVDRMVESLGRAAQCLASECDAPELWNKLTNNSGDNPLAEFETWYSELPSRMHQLEYDALIEEGKAYIERVQQLRGGTARMHEAYLSGRLGELLFHSGKAAESLPLFQVAYDICKACDDTDGQHAYLSNLLEAHCYLDDGQAVTTAERLRDLQQKVGVATDVLEKRLAMLREGTPLCRVVCVHNDQQLELDEIRDPGEGSYQFEFRRNRLSLHKATSLTNQGNKLASSGELSDALDKYHAANEVDPHDPDPVYQSGMCLLELGAYAKARESFEEVERLAPGWFRCRTDRWLANGLDDGSISNDEFMLLRVLDDGGLDASKAIDIAKNAIERFPDFAPFYLCWGDASSDEAEAIAAYRKGLDLVEEPDLQSRLLCALAGRLPADASERKQLVQRALQLDGSLIACATAKIMGLF